jgi:uroporphyrinogen decarboxylase
MTPRERMQAALKREPTDRTPRHEHFWPETTDVWVTQGLAPGTDLADVTESDLRAVDSYDRTLRLPEAILEEREEWVIRRDGNGATKKYWKHRSGVPEFTGEFAVQTREQWNEYRDRLVDPVGRLKADETVRASQAFRDADYFVAWGTLGFWESARDVLGPETLLLNVAMDPDWICDMIEHFAALFISMYEQFRGAGGYMDGLFFYEDLGYRGGMFMSPESYRDLIWPSHQRIFQRVREDNVPVIVHSCGQVTQAVDSLLEAGMDCLQPLEAKAGMDLHELKPRYGDRLSFMGNVDVMILQTNNRDAVRREVTAKLEAGSTGGGYIFHSDHSIPPGVDLATYRFCLELLEEFDQAHS